MYSHKTPLLCAGRLYLAIIACGLALAGLAAWSARPARADGDPASDVLATGSLFLPQDAGIPPAQLEQLGAIVLAAHQAGYPVRLAVIASPTDLGSIGELWGEPASYASFLGQELSLTYQGLLLVVMPDGFGVYQHGRPTGSEQAALAGVRINRSGVGLADTALTAIQRLAAEAGHRLALPPAQAQGNTGSSDLVAWIVFAIGLMLILTSWAASLRARPLGQPRSA